MHHSPIQIKNLSFSLTHKTCFDNFNATVVYGSRIGIIGRNGAGKSTLLNMIHGKVEPADGRVQVPLNARIGVVEQIIDEFHDLSGGMRLNKALTQALAIDPNILLLDEPSNHFDKYNRSALIRLLRLFDGTLFIVSHDIELLESCVNTLWHIDNGQIDVFKGNYKDYINELNIKKDSIERSLSQINLQRKESHNALMKEQARAKTSRQAGKKHIEQRKWPTIVSDAKARRSEQTSGQKSKAIQQKKQELIDKLSELHLPKIIKVKFSLTSADLRLGKSLICINEGALGYETTFLHNINLQVSVGDRIAISGNNGTGKSSLIKAILDDKSLNKSGVWQLPPIKDIGYLDQHYQTLSNNETVLESIEKVVPDWSVEQIRRHLGDFLFYENEQVNSFVSTLSGGEKARLSLALIAANTPKLLLLDEITNNLDLLTKEHVILVLREYPGTMIVISHDDEFIKAIGITAFYEIKDGILV